MTSTGGGKAKMQMMSCQVSQFGLVLQDPIGFLVQQEHLVIPWPAFLSERELFRTDRWRTLAQETAVSVH